MKKSLFKTLLFAMILTFIAFSLIAFPQEALSASKRGLKMWWEVVFPSLLPFFIASELLISYGIVRFVGILLEPLMRPLFRVPGAGGFVWAMGMASGFPAGAKLTARLRQERQLSQIEAERLVSFTNSSNPLFIFGAVAVGFFQNAKLGILLAAAHYLGNFCVGLCMRFYGKKEESVQDKKVSKFPLKEAILALHDTRVNETRPFGKILGDAVISSIQTLLMIGGFIILFSVFNQLLSLLHITEQLAKLFIFILSIFQIPGQLSVPLLSGMFEITLGNQLTSQTEGVELLEQIIIASFILGFSGFSVHAQVASILAETDIRFKPFFYARFIQGALAAIFAYLLWKPLYINMLEEEKQVFHILQYKVSYSWLEQLWQYMMNIGPLITICSISLYIIIYFRRHIMIGK